MSPLPPKTHLGIDFRSVVLRLNVEAWRKRGDPKNSKGEATRCQDSALPRGLQVERGPDGVFEYIMEKLPAFIES